MLGVFRFILVLFVIIYHLVPGVGSLGPLAVVSFYVISGYLITLILHETYHFQIIPFIINRFLRVYPAYYVIAILTVAIFYITANITNPNLFHPSWTISYRASDILGNTLLFPWAFLNDKMVPVTWQQPHLFYFRLVPSTWFIGIELVCYGILFVFTARNIKNSILTLLLAVGWHLLIALTHMDSSLRYYPVFAALLPISLGSLAYFIRNRISTKAMRIIRLVFSWTIPLMFVLNWYIQYASNIPIFDSASLYIASFIAIFATVAYGTIQYSGIRSKVDKLLGDLSYPLFLGHYITAFLGWIIIGKPQENRGWTVLFIGLIINILLSIVILLFVDRPVSYLRKKMRAYNHLLIHKKIFS